jgi:hypothetical protein
MPPPARDRRNEIVNDVEGELLPHARLTREGEPAGMLAEASGMPELVVFAGFLGDVVTKPHSDEDWRVLYLDLALTTWLLIEARGILNFKSIGDPLLQPIERDVLWVDKDAVVGRGHGHSIEKQFLTGEFTRAGDFEAPPDGGGSGAATGVFCEARTPSCCYRLSRR